MKATELRIGNLVQANGVYEGSVKTFERFNDDLTVAFFSDGSPHGIGEFLKDCEPIPLTEEWLLRFGFEIRYYDEIGGHLWAKDSFEGSLYDNGEFQLLGYELTPCEHVHSLQNLFFAITGEELELK